MKLLVNEAIDREEWKDFIARNIFASPFQTSAFYDFYNSNAGYSAEALAVESNGRLCALAVVTIQKEQGIKGFFSRRGIIYGGPLFETDQPEALDFLLTRLDSFLMKKVIYLETRNFFDYCNRLDIFTNRGWLYLPYCNFQMKLERKNLEEIFSDMDYNRRREIRLSLKEGALYEECRNEGEVEDLFAILSELYRERVKLPLPSLKFFQAFYKTGICKVFVVKHNNTVIGGSFCPVLQSRAIYTFYYCGIRNYHKKIFPTHLAVLAAIDYGLNNNIHLLDFMGAGKPGFEYGVRKYKKEFGGELVDHGRFLKVTQPMLYNIGKAGLSILSKIKR